MLALWAALTIGSMGVQVGAWAGWLGAPALPPDHVAVELAGQAAPGIGVGGIKRADEVFGYEYDLDDDPGFPVELVGTDERYQPGAVAVSFPLPAEDGTALAAARRNLAAAGWQVAEREATVVAHRDGWHLSVEEDYDSWYNDIAGPSLVVRVIRAEPARVWWCSLGGFLLGLLPGWWLAGALRRTVPYAAALLCGSLLLLLPQPLISVPVLFAPWWRDAAVPPEAAWGVNNELVASCCAGVAGVLFAALLLAAAARHHRLVRKAVPQRVRMAAALAASELRDRPPARR